MNEKIKIAPLNLVALIALVVSFFFALFLFDEAARKQEQTAKDADVYLSYFEAYSQVEPLETRLQMREEKLQDLQAQAGALANAVPDTPEYGFAYHLMNHHYDIGIEQVVKELFRLTQYHPDMGVTRDDAAFEFLNTGIIDVDGSFTWLFYDCPAIYVNVGNITPNNIYPYKEGMSIKYGNSNGQDAYWHPLYDFEYHVIEGDLTHFTLFLSVGYSVYSKSEHHDGVVPAVIIAECEAVDGDISNWKINTVKASLIYGALLHHTETRTYTAFSGKELNLS